MKVVTREGDVLGGAAAFAHVAQFVWWAWPLAFVWRFEICRKALRGVYRRVAENRHCVDAVCGISPRDAQRGLDLSVRQHDRKTQETAHPPDEENPYALEL